MRFKRNRTETKYRDAVAFHDSLAREWEGRYRNGRFASRLRILSELLPEQQIGRRWLDAGCGTGTIARWLARERGAQVIAIDASKRMLATARAWPGVTFVNADALQCCFSAGAFDGIICSSVIEYLENPKSALKEFARLLTAGGLAIISAPHAAISVRIPLKMIYWLTMYFRDRRRYEFLDYSLHSYRKDGLTKLLSSAGFLPEKVVEFGTINLPFRFRSPFPGALLMSRAVKRAA